MKQDIDRYMQESGIDALLVTGPGQHNPAMVYLTGGGHITRADLIKKRGEDPVLFHASMERDEAAKSGLRTIGYDTFDMAALMKQAEGNRTKAAALRYAAMLRTSGINGGRVALYGQVELANAFAVFTELARVMPELELVGLDPDRIFLPAMMTKGPEEIDRIRRMGKITTAVVARVADFLTGQRVKGNILVKSDDTPLTIGDVKSKIDLWLAEMGAANPEGTIFAIGRDAGVPHSTGNPADFLTLGKTIVFDIFPCENGGGYFYDFTRTWCLGYAPDEELKLYEEVRQVYDRLLSELKVSTPFPAYQKRTCELFEEMGHPTVLSQPATEEGYVHSLGHGVGLRVHEKPFAGMLTAEADDLLIPGAVFTMEPGLYYPERGMGVRIEDTLTVKNDGTFEILADFPKDLILPVK